MDYRWLHQIPSLPGNPLVAVAPFLPAGEGGRLPPLGRMISEVILVNLWQMPSLNLYHPWLMVKNNNFHITRQELSVEEYARRFGRRRVDILITGTHGMVGSKIRIEGMVFRLKSKGLPELLGKIEAWGEFERLLEWLSTVPYTLLRISFPESLREQANTKRFQLDAPLDAFELACAAIDCTSFADSAQLARYYIRRALEIAPHSVYLRFTAVLAGLERRDARFCSQLVQDNPHFVPAYFPDDSIDSEEVDELTLARDLYLRGLALVPLNIHSYFGLRQICIRLGDAESLIPFAKLHTVRGTFSSSSSLFGDTFVTCIEEATEQGKYDMARELFEAGMSMAEDADAQSMLYEARACCEEQAGNLPEAVVYYEHALRARPSLKLKKRIADIYFKQQRYDEAVNLYTGLLRRRLARDTKLLVQYRLANSLEHLGRYSHAIPLYREICEMPVSSDLTYTVWVNAYNRLRALGYYPWEEADQRTNRTTDE